ncbi:DinB family protein [Streptomyces sp. SID10853]|uniref:DinB family protein n=1 Tax=Streptomyces sp. SID10853 TaxID=2706028 RepID=UPI0013BF1C9A|nr:DinB family protein [Streptomyces sp. SID10853]NDZ81476.1 DinB family protein [Streptomyces sp. SID10853]
MTAGRFSPTTERDALCAFLDGQRAALTRKVTGISDADARRTPTVSTLSLLGILKHCALWERRWFRIIAAGEIFPGEWPANGEQDTDLEDFRVDERDTVEQWLATYEERSAASRKVVAAMGLDDPCGWPQAADRNLRWVLLHMIEETARHAGHADIIRETLDGSSGV